jgi:LacI family transcriptional regulator, gluconate utilization system Gnt-I transcriptional repressor
VGAATPYRANERQAGFKLHADCDGRGRPRVLLLIESPVSECKGSSLGRYALTLLADTMDESKRLSRRSRGTGRVRIEDVALAAGVSAQSVSRFLREPGRVGADTSARISSAITAVGYVPNMIAGSLASNRSRIVGILLPTIANPAHAGPVEGLAAALRDSAYEVLVGTTAYDAVTEDRLIRAFVGRRVDGLVITSDELSSEVRNILKAYGAPVVQIWELPELPFDMAVGVSNRAIGQAVARHFAERGYRDCLAIGHAQRTDTRSAARVSGFAEGLAAAGLPAPRRIEVNLPAALNAAGQILERMKSEGLPRAVFCTSGQLTVAMHLAISRAGLTMPQDVALMGLESDLSSMVEPALSVIRVDTYAFGLRAGALLLDRLAGRPAGNAAVDIGFDMLIRGTT